MSVIIGKEETESHLLGWLTQAGSLERDGLKKNLISQSALFPQLAIRLSFPLGDGIPTSSAMLLVLSSYSDASSVQSFEAPKLLIPMISQAFLQTQGLVSVLSAFAV